MRSSLLRGCAPCIRTILVRFIITRKVGSGYFPADKKLLRGQAFAALGRYDEGLNVLREYLELVDLGNQLHALQEIASLCARAKKYDEAARYFERLLSFVDGTAF